MHSTGAAFLDDVCEPYIRIFRRILPSLGPRPVPIVASSRSSSPTRVVDLIGRLL